jgi:hypothetical protein
MQAEELVGSVRQLSAKQSKRYSTSAKPKITLCAFFGGPPSRGRMESADNDGAPPCESLVKR